MSINRKMWLNIFDSIYFRGKSHFEEDGAQNYLIFKPMYRYFKKISGNLLKKYIFIFENLKFCLMKRLTLLVHLIIVIL